MELIQYGSLRTYIRGTLMATAPPARTWKVRLALLADVASGMAFLHQHGCLHRDLKSANVLIGASKQAPNVVAKVSDFGTLHDALADRSIRMVRTRDGQLRRSMCLVETMDGDRSMTAGIGTPMYMAPVCNLLLIDDVLKSSRVTLQEVLCGGDYSKPADVFRYVSRVYLH
jgi:serine/threonine protein kinase